MATLFLQKPKPLPTLFTLAAVIVCTGLGIWQLQRREWKHDLIHRIDTRVALPAVPLPGHIDHPDDWDYRHVTVTGTFRNDQESYLRAQSRHGNFGWQVITPLVRPDGETVLVNRGWVPDEKRDPASRAEGELQGSVTVTGLVRLPWYQKWLASKFIPPADAKRHLFFEGDLEGMAKDYGLDVMPVFVEADDTPVPGGFPIGGQTALKISDPHLNYAIQWFSFALIAAVIFFLYHRRKD
ncbi:MAG: SURF1 family protein [Alphaproteobacteria bacterium]|nr:SURF1 family protein [Alphaproteobacteria bacterium]